MSVYLDHNASTHLDPRVLERMLPLLSGPAANASSLHRYGRIARDAVEQARVEVAQLAGCQAKEVLFTSGGTEANNLAIKGVTDLARTPEAILYGATEHPSVMEAAEALSPRGWTVRAIPVCSDGRLQDGALSALLAQHPVRLVSVMQANNETGVIHALDLPVAAAHAAGALFHVDATQAAGKLALDFAALDADLMTLSSHKLYGPKGTGALVVRHGIEVVPQLHGGAQEEGLRGGTENVAAIAGFGAAATLARAELDARIAHTLALRERLIAGLQQLPGALIFGAASPRLCNTVQFALPGWDGEALLMALDRRGLAVSSGSACKAGFGEPSHVLTAMGYERFTAKGAVRVSMGKDNREADVDQLLAALLDLTRKVA